MKINQKYRLNTDMNPTPSNILRVLNIKGNIVTMERCEHHEGLAHESFELSKEILKEKYTLI